jgi:hypothetical protein
MRIAKSVGAILNRLLMSMGEIELEGLAVG